MATVTAKAVQGGAVGALGQYGLGQQKIFRVGHFEIQRTGLYQALEQIGPIATDEASAMEAMGLHPRLVPGGAQNFKVTYPDDFALASAVLAQRGHGTTLERFGGGRVAPTLGG